MNRCSKINCFFAALIFVAHLNCVVEHQLIAPLETSSVCQQNESSHDSLPLSDNHSNDCHESGCICKGATQVDGFVLVDSGFSEFFQVQPVLAPSFFQLNWLERNRIASPPDYLTAAPLRALDRCVILQSFLI